MEDPPQAPVFNTYTFDSAYRLPASLGYATPPLDSPTTSVFPRLAPLQSHSQSLRFPQERSIAEPGTPPLDMSLLTDTSSLDESISNEPFLPTTALLRHGEPNIHTQTPSSDGRILQGLGLFESDGKPLAGMGLLSGRFGGLETDVEDEASEDGAENEDDTRLSKTFLREALLTFCRDSALPQENVDVFSTPVSTGASAITSTPISSTNRSHVKQHPRASASTTSSQLACLPKNLKAGKVSQKDEDWDLCGRFDDPTTEN